MPQRLPKRAHLRPHLQAGLPKQTPLHAALSKAALTTWLAWLAPWCHLAHANIPPEQPTTVGLNLSLDDSGAQATGAYQTGATLSLNNLFSTQDHFYITLTHDLNALGHPKGNPGLGERGTEGRTLHYSLPIGGDWHLAFNRCESFSRQNITGASSNYLHSDQSDNRDIQLSYAVHHNTQTQSSLSLKASASNSLALLDTTSVRRQVGGWQLSFAHATQIGPTTLDSTLSYKRGTDDFGAQPEPEEINQTDPSTGTGHFGLIQLDASVRHPFTLGKREWRYHNTLHLQNTNTALTSADYIGIGGRSSVRGFDGESSLSAERGYTLRNELGLLLRPGTHLLYLGVDYGEVSGPNSDKLAGRSLTGAVLGLRADHKLGIGKLQHDLFVGGPLNRPSNFQTAQTNAGFNLNWSF